MVKVALLFWGLSRSLKYTLPSIQKRMLDVLKTNNIEYKIFQHTYKLESVYNNSRAGERGVNLDNEEYKLLKADYVLVDDQDEVKEKIGLEQYRTHRDPWDKGNPNYTKYSCVDNFLCAMYSKSQVTLLLEKSKYDFDYAIFMRPDMTYINDFKIDFLSFSNDKTLVIPNFALYGGFNDRFAITNKVTYKIYGDLFPHLLPFSKRRPLHSERTQIRLFTRSFKLGIKLIPFFFNRTRCHGKIKKDFYIRDMNRQLKEWNQKQEQEQKQETSSDANDDNKPKDQVKHDQKTEKSKDS